MGIFDNLGPIMFGNNWDDRTPISDWLFGQQIPQAAYGQKGIGSDAVSPLQSAPAPTAGLPLAPPVGYAGFGMQPSAPQPAPATQEMMPRARGGAASAPIPQLPQPEQPQGAQFTGRSVPSILQQFQGGLLGDLGNILAGGSPEQLAAQQQTMAMYHYAKNNLKLPEQQAQLFALNKDAANEFLKAKYNAQFKMPETVQAYIAHQLANNPNATVDQGLDALRKVNQAEATGKSAGDVIGKTGAESQISYDSDVANLKETMRLGQELKNHPGRKGMFWHSMIAPYVKNDMIPGNTQDADAAKILDQIGSQSFQDSIQKMRGLGSLSNAEGLKVQQAMQRLSRSQTYEGFNKALDDMNGALRLLIDSVSQKAGRPAPNSFQGNQNQGTVFGVPWSVNK